MAKLWFFNPWNDLALACDSEYYTPPPTALNVAASGETFPLDFASPDDYVLLSPDGIKKWEEMADSSQNSIARPWLGEKIDQCEPWGWSKAVRAIFRRAGVEENILPDDEYIGNVRNLCHRRHTIGTHRFFNTDFIPIEASDSGECVEALELWGKVIGKYPWSSTGRGIFSGEERFKDSFLRRCSGSIAHQGSVMIEPAYDVVKDFAMLFYCYKNGSVEFKAYSLFENFKRAYVRNLPFGQDQIEKILTAYVSRQRIEEVKEGMKIYLERLIACRYHGWIGVDMMIYGNPPLTGCRKKNSYEVNPCVEMNFRYTMGVYSYLKGGN